MIPHRFHIAAAMALVIVGCAMPHPAPRASRTTVAAVSSRRPESPVLVRKKNGQYRVAKPWTVSLNGTDWHIQKGYTSNGITAPSSIKRSLGDGVNEPETWAAMFHDWLFTQPGISRERADRLFLELLEAYGVSQFKAQLMYSGVSAYSASKGAR